MMIAFSLLALVASASAAAPEHGLASAVPASGVTSSAVVASASAELSAADPTALATAPGRDSYSAPGSAARPVARFVDRASIHIGRPADGRMVDLRTLSSPCVLRVIRS